MKNFAIHISRTRKPSVKFCNFLTLFLKTVLKKSWYVLWCLYINPFEEQQNLYCIFFYFQGDFWIFKSTSTFIQRCSICRSSDSIVSEDSRIEPWTVATLALAVRIQERWIVCSICHTLATKGAGYVPVDPLLDCSSHLRAQSKPFPQNHCFKWRDNL